MIMMIIWKEGVHPRLGTNLMFEWKGNYERAVKHWLIVATLLKGGLTGVSIYALINM